MTVERLPLVLPTPAGISETRPGPPHRGGPAIPGLDYWSKIAGPLPLALQL